jgi:hypothetical protein
MRGALPLPLWAVALVLAALAPLMAKALASMLERRSRERSARILGVVEQQRKLATNEAGEPR